MGQKSRLPIIIDEAPQLRAAFLNKCGFFKEGHITGGSFELALNDGNILKVRIVAIFTNGESKVILQYDWAGQSVREQIELTSRRCNLATGGNIYGFVCPYSGKRARKLIFVHGRFMHLELVPGGLYRSQTRSHKWRDMDRRYKSYLEMDEILAELKKPHFKKSHLGKPTKRYLRLLERLQEARAVDPNEVLQAVKAWGKRK
ncbi:hypothetical protein [Maribacter polysaccharolyticus]|uniref:hypothetical protein n=1 Tax=Maribacter polysaccharolyticus TaxID=3020831 RepID=UPI00237F2E83|nr:hypothetical protein [Maribacter polysaccharolyticus]MDE3741671.1 hypothetical protein [Maribacter polysaccharolyticus]